MRVLVVEDEKKTASFVRKALQAEGFAVDVCHNGDDALAVARGHEGRALHLLITDVVMSGMNGVELSRRLAVVRPDIKVLLTSGYSEDVIGHHRIYENGLNFIAKPFTPQDLARKIRETLDH